MGGGGLRILPHKKWHVWRRANIERVLKDERENEERQKDLDVKQRRLEQEKRAQQILLTEEHEDQQQGRQHINFFKAEEVQMSRKKAAKHGKKMENDVSDETLRRYGKLPWYARLEDTEKKELTVEQKRKRKRKLEVTDPLLQMRPKEKRGQRPLVAARFEEEHRSRHVEEEEGPTGSDRRKYDARYDCSLMSPGHRNWRRYIEEGEEPDKASNKRSRYRKKKSKSKHKLGNEDALLQELRRERQERETHERRRAERLTYG
ncbi:unnamed protein product [Peronospora destructor]|uniref:CBF1-interacting co-repressor CIR N-terminal domain-containing protein n=1 Tax=Peronospora destructor TaxID=86335 RepID=A0AAV0UH23_9STRA|nr:unnamed protein product [Peronospora destructor]